MNLTLEIFLVLLAATAALSMASVNASPWPARKDREFTDLFRQTQGVNAADVATSIPLSDGRVLWLFGDCYIDQYDPATGTLPCLFNARNALWVHEPGSLAPPRTLHNSQSPDKTLLLPPGVKPGDIWPCFWPGAGFQTGNTIYIYLMEMDKTPEGGLWGFRSVGPYWAKLSLTDLTVSGYVKLPSYNGIHFWCGFVQDGKSGWTYAYGVKGPRPSHIFAARFPIEEPESPWTFWDGRDWTGDVTHAAAIAQGDGFSVGVCRVKDRFLLISSEFSSGCDQGRKIYAAVGDSPAGPFSPRREIYAIDDTDRGHYPLFYWVAAHPEFINDRGELLITYCINGYAPAIPFCDNGRVNPEHYRPRAIRLPLSWLDLGG